MPRTLALLAIVCTAISVAGCEEKPSTPPTATDKLRQAGNAMKDAGTIMADKAKDAAGTLADKAKVEVQDLMDDVKRRSDSLARGAENLKQEQKPEFDKAMASIRSGWDDLSREFAALKDKSGEALMTALNSLREKGLELRSKIKTTAEKFNIEMK